MARPRSRGAGFIALGAGAALLLAACNSPEAPPAKPSPSADDTTPVTLTITTFLDFGYEGLYEEYMTEHPNVTIEATNIEGGVAGARTDALAKLAAGSGLTDIVAVEEGWLGGIMVPGVSSQFVDLRDFGIEDRAGDWLDWAYARGTDPDGRVIGYPTDIGPEGICYRGDLLSAAGIGENREEVAAALDGDWENFFDVGRRYHAATGAAWFDHSGFVWNAMVSQLPEGYYTAEGELNVEGNTELRARWDLLAAAVADGLSARQEAWNWNGGASFVDGTFATFVCPGWMLSVVQGNTEAGGGGPETGWDFADVFPGGAANWGGSFLAVSATSEHQAAAAALADWLTQPDQQVAQVEVTGTSPSTIAAAEQLAANATPNAFFNDAPVNAIVSSRAEGIVPPFRGPDDWIIREDVFSPAVRALDQGTAGAAAWDQAMTLLHELVPNG